MLSNGLNFIIKNRKKIDKWKKISKTPKIVYLKKKKKKEKKKEKYIPAMSWGFIYWREFLISKK